jgi:hypothetical protein
MQFPLGAMTVGDILDRGLKLVFARLPAFYLINLIVQTPVIIFQIIWPILLGDHDALDLVALATSFGMLFLGLILALILQPIATAAILYLVMEEYAGRRPTVKQAFSFAFSRFVSLLGASLIVGLLVGLGLIMVCVPGIYFAITYVFVSQAVVLERLGASDAMTRSQELITGHRWRVFGILLLVVVAAIIIQVVVMQMLQFFLPAQELIPAENKRPMIIINPLNHIINTIILQIVSILFGTFIAACTTLLYLDLRIRKEGFDLELAAQMGVEPSENDSYRDEDRHGHNDRYDDDRDRGDSR